VFAGGSFKRPRPSNKKKSLSRDEKSSADRSARPSALVFERFALFAFTPANTDWEVTSVGEIMPV
jgi:hypothetical protein